MRVVGLIISIFSLLSGVSCRKLDPVNVVIITIDTTRADHLACYGHPRASTPSIDALAKEGVLFENAFTPVPITCPSHATIMTGKVPIGHGIRDNGIFILPENQETLAEILKANGYACAAGIGAFPLLSRFGLDQGFDLYDERLGVEFNDLEGNRSIRKQRLFFDERKAALVNESVFPWLNENHQTPFFLWLHYFDPHHPHEAPAPYDHRFADNPYLGEIAYADECVGVLIEKLKTLGVYENTLIVVTSDHGEGNGEHNEQTHSFLAYNSTLHVPLVIRNPGGASGRRVSKRVGTVDLFPTILDRIGIRIADDLHGNSLKHWLASGEPEKDKAIQHSLYAETLSPRLSHGLGEIRAYYDGDYKYLHGPIKELFNVTDDPRETRNLIEKEPSVAASMRSKLEDYLAATAPETSNQPIAVDEETARRLMALGYLGSGGLVEVGQETLRDDGIAPQDRVVDNALLSRAKHWIHQRRPLFAREAINDLLERAPENPVYLLLLAECEQIAGNLPESIRLYENLLELENATSIVEPHKILLLMAQMELSLGQIDPALTLLQESISIHETTQGFFLLSQILLERGDEEGYLAALERSLAFDDVSNAALTQWGVALAERGDRTDAERILREALKKEPYSARIHYNLAAIAKENGELSHAIQLAERAIFLDRNYILAYYFCFQLYRESGEAEKAGRILIEAEKTAPNHPLIRVMKEM